MESDRITIRFADRVLSAARRAAGDKPLAEWVRGLVEAATGVSEPMPRGLAAVPKRRRLSIARSGVEARARKKNSEAAAESS